MSCFSFLMAYISDNCAPPPRELLAIAGYLLVATAREWVLWACGRWKPGILTTILLFMRNLVPNSNRLSLRYCTRRGVIGKVKMKRRTIGIKEMKETRRERKCSRKQAQTQGPEAGDHIKRKNTCLYQKMVFPFTLILYGQMAFILEKL